MRVHKPPDKLCVPPFYRVGVKSRGERIRLAWEGSEKYGLSTHTVGRASQRACKPLKPLLALSPAGPAQPANGKQDRVTLQTDCGPEHRNATEAIKPTPTLFEKDDRSSYWTPGHCFIFTQYLSSIFLLTYGQKPTL